MPIRYFRFPHEQCFEDLWLFFDFLLFADLDDLHDFADLARFADFLLLAGLAHFADLSLPADCLLFLDLHFCGDLGGQSPVAVMLEPQDEPCFAFRNAALNLFLFPSFDPNSDPA
ncbi:MAG: hypothetical protein ACOYOJ_06155 [Alsobacter sp.]